VLANGDVHLDNSGVKGSVDTSAASSVNVGPTTIDSGSIDNTRTDSSKTLPPRTRNTPGSITVGGQHQNDARQQPIYSQQPVPSSSSSSSSGVSSSVSQNIVQVMPTYIQTAVTSVSTCSSSLSTSEMFRRSTMAEMHPSIVAQSTLSQGPGSAVARLFGSSSTQPCVRRPAADISGSSPVSRGRRSLHHSWVRPGGHTNIFSNAEAAYTTLTSAVAASRPAAVATVAASDDSQAPNHF